jgi:hypothetical protein
MHKINTSKDSYWLTFLKSQAILAKELVHVSSQLK